MTSTEVGLGPGEARSRGDSVQDILARDGTPPPDVLREVSYDYLGSDDIPRERYISREWHDLEVERLWRRCWQVACREEDIPDVGDTHVYDIADASLVVVRTAPDRIKAFHNSCLHRGAALRTGDGNVAQLRCGFHGFTWNLDGSLKSIPCAWDFPQVEPSNFHLPEALVDTWGGWVFVNMDLDAMPLRDYLGEFPQKFPWHNEDFSKQAHVARVIGCNWKVALEAFIESFHVIATHPQLLETLGDANTQYDVYRGQPRWNRMITPQAVQSPHLPDELTEQQIMDAMIGMFMPAGAYFPVAEGQTTRALLGAMVRGQLQSVVGADAVVSESEALDAIEYYVFPNFVPWGGYARINYRFRPYGNDPDRCIMDVMLLSPCAPGKPRPTPAKVHWLEPDEKWTAAPELGALGPIFNQDMGNLPNVQRGLHASRKPGVTLGNYQEVRIRHYHEELTRWLAR